MCGIDLPIPECQLIAHQPRIEEIAFIGEADFFVGVQGQQVLEQKALIKQQKNNYF